MYMHEKAINHLYRGNKDTCSLPALVSDKRPCEVVTNMVIEGKGCVESTANVEVAGIQVDSPLLAHTWHISIPRCQHQGIPHYRPLSAPSTNHSTLSCPTPNIGGQIYRQKEKEQVLDKQTNTSAAAAPEKRSGNFEHQMVAYWFTRHCSGLVLGCQLFRLYLQKEGSGNIEIHLCSLLLKTLRWWPTNHK